MVPGGEVSLVGRGLAEGGGEAEAGGEGGDAGGAARAVRQGRPWDDSWQTW